MPDKCSVLNILIQHNHTIIGQEMSCSRFRPPQTAMWYL